MHPALPLLRFPVIPTQSAVISPHKAGVAVFAPCAPASAFVTPHCNSSLLSRSTSTYLPIS
jgi:hypothetical protein